MPVAEVIHDGIEGLLVPMDQPDKLASRVLHLLDNPALRDRLGAAAREAALAWDQSQTLPRLAQLIEQPGLSGP